MQSQPGCCSLFHPAIAHPCANQSTDPCNHQTEAQIQEGGLRLCVLLEDIWPCADSESITQSAEHTQTHTSSVNHSLIITVGASMHVHKESSSWSTYPGTRSAAQGISLGGHAHTHGTLFLTPSPGRAPTSTRMHTPSLPASLCQPRLATARTPPISRGASLTTHPHCDA